jgi:ribonuclease G
VGPILYAYLTKGLFWSSKAAKWRRKFGQKITVQEDSTYHLTEYHFFNKDGEEIKL